MRYYYVAQVNGGRVVKVATDKKKLELHDCYKAIGCEMVEMVGAKVGGKSYIIILDEEGKLKGRALNPVATRLYCNLYGRPVDCIVGKAVIAKTSGWATFTEEQATVFDRDLKASGVEIVELSEEAIQ